MRAKNLIAALAGAAVWLWSRTPADVTVLMGLAALELLAGWVVAWRSRRHWADVFDPWVRTVAYYVILLGVAALAGPRFGVPAVRTLASVLVAGEVTRLWRLLSALGAVVGIDESLLGGANGGIRPAQAEKVSPK